MAEKASYGGQHKLSERKPSRNDKRKATTERKGNCWACGDNKGPSIG